MYKNVYPFTEAILFRPMYDDDIATDKKRTK